MNLYVGTSGYSYPKWKGRFYPRNLTQKQMLHYYSEHFQTVELNDTFRKLPTPSVLQERAQDVPDHFRFAIKAPQRITHFRRLRDVNDLMAQLFEVAAVLKKRLGPILFQLPPNFKKDVPRLAAFLDLLPSRRRVAFEFRHQSWFDDEVFGLLRKYRAVLCIADAEGDLDIPFVATADWGYVRLRRSNYSAAAMKKWLKRIREPRWREVFVYFKHEDEAKGPRFAQRLLDLDSSAG
jgi:uncharacterized protein YecE (DUF72 family)